MLQLRIHKSCAQKFYFSRNGAPRKTRVIIKKETNSLCRLDNVSRHGK